VPAVDVSCLRCRVERDGACQLEAVLYTELVADAAVADLLPINAIRNAATLPVRTAFIALLDVDLLPSRAFLPSLNARQGQCAAAGPTLCSGLRRHMYSVGLAALSRPEASLLCSTLE